MTKLKSLMFPLAVLSLLLAAMIAKALAADDKPALPLPAKEAFDPSLVIAAANELVEADQVLTKATSAESALAGELEALTKKHDDAVTAKNTAIAKRLSIHRKIGDLMGIHANDAQLKEPPKVEPHKPPAPIRIEREAEAAKPKTIIGIYTGANCLYCEALIQAIKDHASTMASYEVHYLSGEPGKKIPYAWAYPHGSADRAKFIDGFSGWDAWIAGVRNCER